jgi:hypothetical protein
MMQIVNQNVNVAKSDDAETLLEKNDNVVIQENL